MDGVRPHGLRGKDYDDDFSESVSIGRLRRRLPVAAKIALVTAALTMAVGASPMPPGVSAFLMRLHRRHLVDTHRQIAVEIALFDASILESDL
jgi:hypothetical protein